MSDSELSFNCGCPSYTVHMLTNTLSVINVARALYIKRTKFWIIEYMYLVVRIELYLGLYIRMCRSCVYM